MSDNTSIEWTRSDDGTPGATWNPVTGCTKISAGCDHCYAETFAERWRGTPGHPFENGFDLTLRPGRLEQPLKWRKPKRIFVNSMSDLFHEGVPEDFIAQVFAVMSLATQHDFQLLTKRHGRMRSLLTSDEFVALVNHHREARNPDRGDFFWPLPNLWMGVSAEDQKWADIRIAALVKTPAAVRFVSAEPLLGPITLHHGHTHCPTHDFSGGFCTGTCPDRITPDWVISGGESGPGARPAHPDWFRQLRDDCTTAGIAYFHKQHGAYTPVRDRPQPGDLWVYPDGTSTKWGPEDGHVRRYDREFRADTFDGESVLVRRVGKKNAGRELDGRTWDEFPTTRTAVA